MKSVFIMLSGDCSPTKLIRTYIQNASICIGADGGADLLVQLFGIPPHEVVGDFDSLSNQTRAYLKDRNIPCIQHPTDKDQTDSELAIERAIEWGADQIIIAGFSGDRIDHMQANIGYSAKRSAHVPIRIISGNQELSFIHLSGTIQGTIGELVSLIPVEGSVRGVTTKGLRYPLSHEALPFGTTRGVSNCMTEKTAHIQIFSGILMVVHTRNL